MKNRSKAPPPSDKKPMFPFMKKGKPPMNAGGNPDVETEAKAKSIGPIGDTVAKPRLDRKRGGRVGDPLPANSSAKPTASAGKC